MKNNILIVDDLEMNRKILSHQINKNNFSADEAVDGLESIKMATSKNYYAILMDIMMPNMDGVEATKLLREKGVTAKIIGIGCSESDIEESIKAGMDDFLVKPIDMKKLNELLNK